MMQKPDFWALRIAHHANAPSAPCGESPCPASQSDPVEFRRLADAFERSADWLDKGVLTGSARTHPLVGTADYRKAGIALRAAAGVIAAAPPLKKMPDTELPGMWERADFEDGQDEVRGPDWKSSRSTGVEMSGWQPIETAPMDGKPILLYEPAGNGCVLVGHVITFPRLQWVTQGAFPMRPTHWMPLPPPPPTGFVSQAAAEGRSADFYAIPHSSRIPKR